MTPIPSLLLTPAYLRLLSSLLGWAGWVALLGGLAAAGWRVRKFEAPGEQRWLLLAIFVALVPLTNLFLGLRLPTGASLPEPGIPQAPYPPSLMFFSALPWMLAGGFLGPLEALGVGLLAGLMRGLWDTHNLFSLLEPAVLALLFSLASRQRYRTLVYRLLRQPLLVAAGLVPVYAVIFIYSAFFSVADTVAARLDFALTNVGPAALAAAGELAVAGLSLQIVALVLPRLWGQRGALEPSPAERSLETRFLFTGAAFVSLLLISLLLGDWIVAGDAARRMLRDRMASTAGVAAESVPFFLETGQNLAVQVAANPAVLTGSGADLSVLLGDQMRAVPYFDQLFVLTLDGKLVAAYPAGDSTGFGLYPQELAGLGLAGAGVAVQIYTLPPAAGGSAARVSFLAAITDEGGTPQRLLLGRTSLDDNPLAQPLIRSLGGTQALGGAGILVDDQGQVLYSPSASQVMTQYSGSRGAAAAFYDLPAPRGTRDLVYYLPVSGRAWSVVLTVPAEAAQQLALDIAVPLSLLVIVLAVLVLVSLRLGLRVVTASLQTLAAESARIARGQLDHPLPGGGEDEVGQLGRAFEQMRQSLQARLEELNQLLLVSQGVASTLQIEDSVRPILEAVQASGASAARLALVPARDLGPAEKPPRFALGPAAERYAPLDERILALAEKQGRLVLPSLKRTHALVLPDGSVPGALVALPLLHENRFDGVLWAAFDAPHAFPEEYLRFLSTLAGYASLAASNARLFRSAEVGRQRLAAILASTPDPVLVTDETGRLLLANPAARSVLGPTDSEGRRLDDQVPLPPELHDLLQGAEGGRRSVELTLPDGKVYYATASAVLADGRPVGRVCILQDVTHFKELDALKSDFVSTVSHDLRSPLTLMRGYSTMLPMVGELNEQQRGYADKITSGVDNMAKLVDTLLDLGRLEAGVDLQIASVALREFAHGVADILQLQAGQKKIRLEVEIVEPLPETIEADRALLQQALYNLIENAIKYTPDGGQVRLIVKGYPGAIQFEVRDNGIGIAAADQPRLFEKFFRGSQREARAQRGSGLGLSIVRSIAERHGGKVWLESQVGQGSTFHLLVPVEQPEMVKKKAG